MVLPETRTSMPFSAQRAAFFSEMPPSTSTMTSRPRFVISSRIARAFGIMSAMKDWPPKPGSTVMTRTMSTSSR